MDGFSGRSDDLPGRDPFVDVVRVAAVLVVVFGHWLTTNVIWDDNIIEIENALSIVRNSHWATWLIQVMPLMFFVGGFANARSLGLHDGVYLAFLRTRYQRLLRPTLVFVLVWLAVGVGEAGLGSRRPNPLDRAADQAALPFWFLGLYLIVVALAPPMLHLHERFGWRVPLLLGTGAAVIDVFHHGLDVPHIGVLNYAFVWLLAHQLGYFYADGGLRSLRRGVAATAAAIGLAGLTLLTMLADYPVSMVGVPGDERWNTNPPSLALVALTIWLIGLVLWGRVPLQQRGTGLTRLHNSALTVFLWHVSAISITAAIIYPLGFPRLETGTWEWWAWRPVWLLVLLPAMLGFVGVFQRFEVHPQPCRFAVADPRRTRHVAAGLGVVSTALGILGFGVTGFNRITEALGEEVLGFEMNPLQNVTHLALGLVLLGAAYGGRGWLRIVTGVAVASYLAVGVVGLPDGIAVLGANSAAAVLHLVVGAAGAALLGWAVVVDCRRQLEVEFDWPVGT